MSAERDRIGKGDRNIFHAISDTLQQHTRGVHIGIYTVAGLSLAFAIHKVRPISKFSRAADVPKHFMKRKEVLEGKVVGWEPSTEGPRILIDHKPLVRIPLWHSGKKPLPVQVWGVKLVGGNGVNWLQCVAAGHQASIIPLGKGKDALIGDVTLHLPITYKTEVGSKKHKVPEFEDLNLGERLVELGLGVVSSDVSHVPPKVDEKWFWLPWVYFKRTDADILQRAEFRARIYRNGLWQERIPNNRFLIFVEYLKSLIGATKRVPVLN